MDYFVSEDSAHTQEEIDAILVEADRKWDSDEVCRYFVKPKELILKGTLKENQHTESEIFLPKYITIQNESSKNGDEKLENSWIRCKKLANRSEKDPLNVRLTVIVQVWVNQPAYPFLCPYCLCDPLEKAIPSFGGTKYLYRHMKSHALIFKKQEDYDIVLRYGIKSSTSCEKTRGREVSDVKSQLDLHDEPITSLHTTKSKKTRKGQKKSLILFVCPFSRPNGCVQQARMIVKPTPHEIAFHARNHTQERSWECCCGRLSKQKSNHVTHMRTCITAYFHYHSQADHELLRRKPKQIQAAAAKIALTRETIKMYDSQNIDTLDASEKKERIEEIAKQIDQKNERKTLLRKRKKSVDSSERETERFVIDEKEVIEISKLTPIDILRVFRLKQLRILCDIYGLSNVGRKKTLYSRICESTQFSSKAPENIINILMKRIQVEKQLSPADLKSRVLKLFAEYSPTESDEFHEKPVSARSFSFQSLYGLLFRNRKLSDPTEFTRGSKSLCHARLLKMELEFEANLGFVHQDWNPPSLG